MKFVRSFVTFICSSLTCTKGTSAALLFVNVILVVSLTESLATLCLSFATRAASFFLILSTVINLPIFPSASIFSFSRFIPVPAVLQTNYFIYKKYLLYLFFLPEHSDRWEFLLLASVGARHGLGADPLGDVRHPHLQRRLGHPPGSQLHKSNLLQGIVGHCSPCLRGGRARWTPRAGAPARRRRRAGPAGAPPPPGCPCTDSSSAARLGWRPGHGSAATQSETL